VYVTRVKDMGAEYGGTGEVYKIVNRLTPSRFFLRSVSCRERRITASKGGGG